LRRQRAGCDGVPGTDSDVGGPDGRADYGRVGLQPGGAAGAAAGGGGRSSAGAGDGGFVSGGSGKQSGRQDRGGDDGGGWGGGGVDAVFLEPGGERGEVREARGETADSSVGRDGPKAEVKSPRWGSEGRKGTTRRRD